MKKIFGPFQIPSLAGAPGRPQNKYEVKKCINAILNTDEYVILTKFHMVRAKIVIF